MAGLGKRLADIDRIRQEAGQTNKLTNLIPESVGDQTTNLALGPTAGVIPQTRTTADTAYLPVNPADPNFRPNNNPQPVSDAQFNNDNFNMQTVYELPDKPENYGFGPDKSTRVLAHKFVPYETRLLNRAGIQHGTVYVQFTRDPSKIYGYKNVPDSVYNSFTVSNSKGRFINNFLENYTYGVENDENTKDFG